MPLLEMEKNPCFRFGFSPVFLSFSIKKINKNFARKNAFSFFSFARGTVLLPPEARLCFRERHGRASFGKEKNAFSVFFSSFVRGTVLLPREARLCFRESHGRASWETGKNTFSVIFLL